MILERLVNWDRNSDEIVIKSLTSLGVKSTRTSYGILEKIVHGILDGVHVCSTNPTDSTSTTGAASRLLNSLNGRCVLSPIVGAKSRLLETFDLKVGGGKPRLLVESEKMLLLFKGNICELMPNLRY